MQLKQDMSISKKHDNALEYFNSYKNEKYILDKENIKKNHKDFLRKNLNTRSRAKNNLLVYIFQEEFLANKLLLSFKKVRFGRQEFFID